ncbi:MAG: AMP-binding protein [bacterium]|nr:AMP-binding protein [bacterium]
MEATATENKTHRKMDIIDIMETYAMTNPTTVPHLIERQVTQQPDKIALVNGESQLSYRQLWQMAGNLSSFLISKEVKRGDLVGLVLDPSSDIVIAMLALMRVGAAYIPITPTYPMERMAYIIKDSGLNTLLTHQPYTDICDHLQWEIPHLTTYIRLDSDRSRGMNGGRDDAAANYTQFKSESRQLWNYTARKADNDYTAAGYVDSYSRMPFSAQEMQEVIDNVMHKVDPFIHDKARVLEVGCGSGLMMFRLAGRVARYVGTDISDQTLNSCRKKAASEGFSNIRLQHLAADEIDQIEPGGFDLIFLNSVLQYFPSYAYLRDFLTKAMALLSPQGVIFIGDIRDKDMQLDYYRSLLPNTQNVDAQLRRKKSIEKELFVPRGFFEDFVLTRHFEALSQCSHKIATVRNELSNYRYDALLKVNKERTPGRKECNRESLKRQFSINPIKPIKPVTAPPVRSDDALYVMYTSGSTGQPKGVIITHGNVAGFSLNMNASFGIGDGDIIYAATTYTFDISVLELICSLLSGLRVVLSNFEAFNQPGKICDVLQRQQISVLQITPSRLKSWLDVAGEDLLNSVNILLIGGEPLPPELVKAIEGKKIFNVYGPTETTIWSSFKQIEKESSITIGKPLLNEQIQIVSVPHEPPCAHHCETMKPGDSGEICISGTGVGRGYLNQAELTARHYVKNLLGDGVTMYRTGDLGLQLDDGQFQYLERIDQQVKIRGFRIELGEIETQLKMMEGIKDALVTARKDGGGYCYLCAYYVSEEKIPPVSLHLFLAAYLPDYMMPTQFVHLKAIPLNANGKADRKALPEPLIAASQNHSAPRDEMEERLTAIWARVLGVAKNAIGIDAGFLESGGHSLSAITIISQLQREFKVMMTLKDFFQCQCIRHMARYIKRAIKGTKQDEAPEPVEIRPYYPLTALQQAFFQDKKNRTNTRNNVTIAYRITGDIDKEQFTRSVQALCQRHESLRTSFHLEAGHPCQRIDNTPEFTIPIQWSRCFSLQDEIAGFVKPFDISTLPLFRLKIIRDSTDNTWTMVLGLHHIVTDNISIQILVKDLARIYDGHTLQKLNFQMKDYAVRQNRLLASGALKKQEAYWHRQLRNFQPSRLPFDGSPSTLPQKEASQDNCRNILLELDEATFDRLRDFCNRQKITRFTFLVAVLQMVVAVESGQKDVTFGMITADRHLMEVRDVVGCLLNTLLIRTRFEENDTLFTAMSRVERNVMAAMDNALYPYEPIAQWLKETRGLDSEKSYIKVNYLTSEKDGTIAGSRLKFSQMVLEKTASRRDFSMLIRDTQQTLILNIIYNAQCYEEKRVAAMAQRFKAIVMKMIDRRDELLSSHSDFERVAGN